MIPFILPDGTIALASSMKEAGRRFREFEKGEEIVDFDALSLSSSASVSAPDSASVSDDSSDNS